MRAFFVAFLLLLFSAFTKIGLAQQIPTRLFSPTDGTAEIRGGLLFKNCDSYLFHAQDNLVRRFDGNNWVVIARLPDSEEITAIGTHQKKIWLGTSNGKLWRERGKDFILFEPEEGQIRASITKILSVDTQLWVASAGDGLYCWSKNRLFRLDTADGMPDLSISDLYLYKNKVWVGSDQGLVSVSFKNEQKNILQYSTQDLLIGSLSSDSTDLWIAYQSGGISKMNSQKILPIGEGLGLLKMKFQHDRFWMLDEVGNLWSTDKNTSKATSLPFVLNNKALRIDDFEFDDNGFLWLSTQFGVVASQIGLRFYTFPTSVQVQSLLEQFVGKMWLGTSTGLLEWDVEAHTFTLLPGTAGLNVLSLYLDYKKRLWIGTYGQGLYLLDSKKLIKVGASHGLHNANIFSMAVSKNQKTLYLGTLGGLYTVHLQANDPSKLVTAFKQNDQSGPGSYYIYQVFVDAKDRLWVGTDGMGAFMHDASGFQRFQASTAGAFRIVTSITEDQNGTTWLSSLDRGLFMVDDNAVKSVDSLTNHPKVEITAIASHQNQLIISSTEGIHQLDLNNQRAFNVNTLYGLPLTEGLTNAVFKSNNKLWLGVKEGVVSLELDVLKGHKAPALRILLNDPSSKSTSDSVFEPTKNALSFSLNSLWGGAPDAIYMRYKLLGLHDEWVGTSKKEVFLQGLRPGSYQLMVESSLYSDFSLVEASNYGFIIKKPFYTSWWFALLLLVLSGLIARIYFNNKERKRKNAEHAKVEQIRGQYELLKSQVSPHFLFNSFNTLLALIDEDQKLASTYVEKLSALFRSVLTYKDTDLITLKEELVLVDAYIYLQQQRFGTNLMVKTDIHPDAFKKMVMPMSLQLLVENAIKHNAISAQKPLFIEITSTEHQVIVKNNLQPKAQSEPSTGFGLSSLEQRYASLFKKQLLIEVNNHYFQVHLPLITPV